MKPLAEYQQSRHTLYMKYLLLVGILVFGMGCNSLDRLVNGPEGDAVQVPALEQPMPIIQPHPEFEQAWLEFRTAHPELTEAEALTQFLQEWQQAHP